MSEPTDIWRIHLSVSCHSLVIWSRKGVWQRRKGGQNYIFNHIWVNVAKILSWNVYSSWSTIHNLLFVCITFIGLNAESNIAHQKVNTMYFGKSLKVRSWHFQDFWFFYKACVSVVDILLHSNPYPKFGPQIQNRSKANNHISFFLQCYMQINICTPSSSNENLNSRACQLLSSYSNPFFHQTQYQSGTPKEQGIGWCPLNTFQIIGGCLPSLLVFKMSGNYA